MLVLGVNTVGQACEVALTDADGAVVASVCEPMTQGHDARLAPLVAQMMRDAGAEMSAIGRIAVVTGPGSFTGVRVGVAFVQGLSLVLGAPAAGVTSLEALDPAPGPGRVLGVLPAKRRPPERSWWAQLLADGAGEGEPVEASLEEVQAMAADADGVCGAGIDREELGRDVAVAVPSALAACRFVARLGADRLARARPVYVRAPDAAPMKPMLKPSMKPPENGR